jgi:hypothetical protein
MQDKIFGIGLGRTGTKSLAQALRILGYSVIHYAQHVNDIVRHEAATDISVACRFEFLDAIFPRSKFIYTTRNIESWLDSSERAAKTKPPWQKLPAEVIEIRWRTYGAVDFDRQQWKTAYDRHHAQVMTHFKDRPDGLLVMNICQGDGWQKLCSFLACDIPEPPFPNIT